MKNKSLTILVLFLTFQFPIHSLAGSSVATDEQLIFFPTNAYWDQGWVLPVHGWIFEYEGDSIWRRGSMAFLERVLEVDRQAKKNPYFKSRAWMFLVDNERGKIIDVAVGNKVFSMNDSRANGHFRGLIKLKTKKAERLADRNGWLKYEAFLPDGDQRRFRGEVQLLDDEGISVISDIDDTIKISRVVKKRKLIKNTFLKKYRAVPGMPKLYRSWAREGASFHYVSGSPWQLYPALTKFMEKQGYPKGSFALRRFRVKDGSFPEFIKQPKKHKTRAIKNLLEDFPYRKFVLVGDSGESDPEIYADFARTYPDQVKLVLIRNVKDRPMDGKRVEAVFRDMDISRWVVFDTAAELIPVAVD